ncbi:MAG: PAS domain S-box protein [Candidatus Cloacimonadota bacterium]|nr:PAS domain S-box protein [Candidatus Cloacimonadota bacterium]
MPKAKILVVEDDGFTKRHIDHMLTYLGYALIGVESIPKIAYAKAINDIPDLLIININIGGHLQGIQLAKKILKERDIPIIYVIPHNESDIVLQTRDTNPFGYLPKPIEKNELFASIEIALYRYGQNKKLRQQKTKFSTFIQQSAFIYFEVDKGSHFTNVNNKLVEITEFSPEELIGSESKEIIISLNFENSLNEIIIGGTESNVGLQECKIRCKNGSVKNFEMNIIPIKEDDEISGFQCTAIEMEELHHYKAYYKNMNVLFVDDEIAFIKSLKRRLIDEEFNQLFATSAEAALEIIRKNEIHVIVADLKMPGMDGMALVREVKSNYPNIIRMILTASTNPMEILESINTGEVYKYLIKPLESTSEFVLYIYEALDFYNLKMMEKQLHESEERYRVLFETSPDGIVITTLDSRNIIYANPAFFHISGYAEKKLYEANFKDFFTNSEERKEIFTTHQISQNHVFHTDIVFVREDTRILYVDITSSVIVIKNNNYLVHFVRDVTDRKIAEESLRESEQKYRTLTNNINVGVYRSSIGALGKHLEVNRSMLDIFGFDSKQEFLELKNKELYEDQQKQKWICDKILKNGFVKNEECNFIKKDGSPFIGSVSAVLVRDRNNEPEYFDGILEDVTDRKYMEMQLRTTQKLEAVGQLAAGISHEINSPVQYLGYNMVLFHESFNSLFDIISKAKEQIPLLANESIAKNDKEQIIRKLIGLLKSEELEQILADVPEALKFSEDGIKRVTQIVKAMREFVHPGQSEKTKIDLNNAITNTVEISRNEWKYTATIETNLDPDLPLVSCVPGEINQVFLNVILNASQAIKKKVGNGNDQKGVIIISTSYKNDANDKSGWVEIKISDNGCGIPKESRQKIFNLFYTTKEVGVGTGQGLAISYNVIVKKHKGNIDFETEVDEGTTFTINLPVDSKEEILDFDENKLNFSETKK